MMSNPAMMQNMMGMMGGGGAGGAPPDLSALSSMMGGMGGAPAPADGDELEEIGLDPPASSPPAGMPGMNPEALAGLANSPEMEALKDDPEMAVRLGGRGGVQQRVQQRVHTISINTVTLGHTSGPVTLCHMQAFFRDLETQGPMAALK